MRCWLAEVYVLPISIALLPPYGYCDSKTNRYGSTMEIPTNRNASTTECIPLSVRRQLTVCYSRHDCHFLLDVSASYRTITGFDEWEHLISNSTSMYKHHFWFPRPDILLLDELWGYVNLLLTHWEVDPKILRIPSFGRIPVENWTRWPQNRGHLQ